MNEELNRDSQYMRFIKFDFKKKKINPPKQPDIPVEKRKTSCPLSSEQCKSPFRKAIKQFDDQNPGMSYFKSLLGYDQDNFSNQIKFLKIDFQQLDQKLLNVLRQVEYKEEDEPAMIRLLEMQNGGQQGSQWNNDETRLLVWIVCKLGLQHNRWRDIGQLINHRSSSECKKKWSQLVQHCSKNLNWSTYEDQTLVNMINTYQSNQQPINWKCMANVLNKTDKQCKDRWYNCLDPQISRDPFVEEDDLELLKLVQKYAKRWYKIQREWQLSKKRSRADIKKRFYELLKQQDSGYESDSSSQSTKFKRELNQEDQIAIQELITSIKQSIEMQIEQTYPRDKELKKKLLLLTKNDLDQMMEGQRKVKIQNQNSSPVDIKPCDQYEEIEEDTIQDDKDQQKSQKNVENTPLMMNNLSRSLLNINLDSPDDQISQEKLHQQVTFNLDSIEQLKHEDLFDIQFCLVNEKSNTLYYANLEFMQSLLNLLTNQRKLLSLTNVYSPKRNQSPQKNNNVKKKFSSQQLIQVFPATDRKFSQFLQ
ncbi:hypothetical protein pb186bvf_014994 [Paramecium bursaria]